MVRNWLRNRNTVEFLGVWERLNNPGFNPVEFDGIRIQTSLNSFTLTPKQLEWCGKAPFYKLDPPAPAEAAGQDAVPKSLRPASLRRSLRSRNHNYITSGIGAVRIDCPPWAGALRYHPWQTTASPFPTIAI